MAVIVEGHNRVATVGTDIIFCEKFNKGLVHPQQELKGYWYDLEDYENEPMPKECKGLGLNEDLPF